MEPVALHRAKIAVLQQLQPSCAAACCTAQAATHTGVEVVYVAFKCSSYRQCPAISKWLCLDGKPVYAGPAGVLNAGFILHEHGRHVLSDLHHRKWVSGGSSDRNPTPLYYQHSTTTAAAAAAVGSWS